MKWVAAIVFLLALVVLPACGGGAASALGTDALASLPAAPWSAQVRYQPATLSFSLAQPAMEFVYVDSVPTGGVVPSSQTFLAGFSAANPRILSGPCSAIATLSYALIAPDAYSGQTTPTVVISAFPRAAGDCAQNIALGSNGTQVFTLHILQ